MQKENDSRLLFLRGKPEIGLDARWLHREAFRVKVRKIADSKAARRGKTFDRSSKRTVVMLLVGRKIPPGSAAPEHQQMRKPGEAEAAVAEESDFSRFLGTTS